MPAVFVLIWSTGFIVARYGMPHAGPMGFLALRFALSVVAFAIWIALAAALSRRPGPAWPQGRAQWAHLAITGVLMHAGYLGGVWAAVKGGMGAGVVALIVGLQPLLTAGWLSAAGARRGQHGNGQQRQHRQHRQQEQANVTAQQWAGVLLGLGGLLLVVWQKLGVGEALPGTLALAALALLSITAGTLYQKRFVQPCDVRTANTVQLAAAGGLMLPLAWLEWQTGQGFDAHPDLWLALAWSVLVLTLGGSSLLYLLIQRGAATQVTSLLYLVPPCTAVLAWLLFDEAMGPVGLGFAFTAAGVALVARGGRAPAADKP
jgi:drug/metabolite transporter (DMT)-like permease